MVSWPDIKRLGRCELGISWGYDRYAANLSGGNLQKMNLIESDFCRTCVLLPFRRVFYKFCWKVMRWVFMDVGMNWSCDSMNFLFFDGKQFARNFEHHPVYWILLNIIWTIEHIIGWQFVSWSWTWQFLIYVLDRCGHFISLRNTESK
jgi:hypothetical protein